MSLIPEEERLHEYTLQWQGKLVHLKPRKYWSLEAKRLLYELDDVRDLPGCGLVVTLGRSWQRDDFWRVAFVTFQEGEPDDRWLRIPISPKPDSGEHGGGLRLFTEDAAYNPGWVDLKKIIDVPHHILGDFRTQKLNRTSFRALIDFCISNRIVPGRSVWA